MHSIFGVHDPLVNCFIPPIFCINMYAIHNRIHKICSCPVYTPMTTCNQGYQYVAIPETYNSTCYNDSKIILCTYYKCLVTADTLYTPIMAAIEGYQYVFLKHICDCLCKNRPCSHLVVIREALV